MHHLAWCCAALVLSPRPLASVRDVTAAPPSWRHTADVRLCEDALPAEDAPPSGDALLMEAMAALKGGQPSQAQELLARAQDAYGDTITEEQQQLLALVGSRVDAAVVPGFGRTTAERPPPPSEAELKSRAEAKAKGERALMLTVSVFGDKTDDERFGKAMALLEEARASFRRAGAEVERERDGMMGNLYAVILAERERSQRVAKLVRMKRLLELTKQKRKAEVFGIDADEFELSLEEGAQGAAEGAAEGTAEGAVEEADVAEEADLAEDILEAWRREGVDSEGDELARIQREIDDLEGSL